ncbi:MAG: hypothetical protein ACRDSR_27155 [Pseudonocardiaceae bacterium]
MKALSAGWRAGERWWGWAVRQTSWEARLGWREEWLFRWCVFLLVCAIWQLLDNVA